MERQLKKLLARRLYGADYDSIMSRLKTSKIDSIVADILQLKDDTLTLLKAEIAGIGSQLLELQQENIRQRQIIKEMEESNHHG